MRNFLVVIILITSGALSAQPSYWQQRITCEMEVDFDHINHQYSGTQRLVYLNNSPDTLRRLFYHLYPNAFQKGSEMDAWKDRLPDPDSRILKGMARMSPQNEGWLHVNNLQMNGQPVQFFENRTILEVTLPAPIAPGRSAIFKLDFEGQVPIQTRRSGRFSAEGVDYSMAQWFPKICNYDYMGWHANPYVQREFYGVWGDYEVTIHIDSSYVLGATGYLQNPQEVGCGYEDPNLPLTPVQSQKKKWHFLAPNVHDFVWAADPDYTHVRKVMTDGTEFHFLYLKTDENQAAWEALPDYVDTALTFINASYGTYPFRKYSVIQGGDGGMEYPMATLITGNRSLRSLVGVTVHELMHNWYQMVMGTNESLYAWMDEGFTSYVSSVVKNQLFPGIDPLFAHVGSYQGYFGLVRSGLEEPLTTHSDHYLSNFSYGNSVYSKGAVFLHQLGYIIGKEALDRTLIQYFTQWQFKHPTPTDFMRVAERESNQELDWYQEYWVNSTRHIDYAIDTAWVADDGLHIHLRQAGTMPMPIDIAILNAATGVKRVTIPLDVQRGEKQVDQYFTPDLVLPDWPWTFGEYHFVLEGKWSDTGTEIKLDPTQRLADVDRSNNNYSIP